MLSGSGRLAVVAGAAAFAGPRAGAAAEFCLIGRGVENIVGGSVTTARKEPSSSSAGARSEMVTTLTAQMSDLLAPISKSTTHKYSTVYQYARIPVKATTLSGAWRPRDPVDDDQGGARA
jgi:hypothetical protein